MFLSKAINGTNNKDRLNSLEFRLINFYFIFITDTPQENEQTDSFKQNKSKFSCHKTK